MHYSHPLCSRFLFYSFCVLLLFIYLVIILCPAGGRVLQQRLTHPNLTIESNLINPCLLSCLYFWGSPSLWCLLALGTAIHLPGPCAASLDLRTASTLAKG